MSTYNRVLNLAEKNKLESFHTVTFFEPKDTVIDTHGLLYAFSQRGEGGLFERMSNNYGMPVFKYKNFELLGLVYTPVEDSPLEPVMCIFDYDTKEFCLCYPYGICVFGNSDEMFQVRMD